jgi:hypothetical protein
LLSVDADVAVSVGFGDESPSRLHPAILIMSAREATQLNPISA